LGIDPEPLGWVRETAAPYLRGYRAMPERSQSLRGFWFLHPKAARPAISPPACPTPGDHPESIGFFIGYLLEDSDFAYLTPEPPECIFFAFVAPPGSDAHQRLVAAQGSLVRKMFEYIRWLTHRPPRFVFHEQGLAIMTRHQSMHDWPREKLDHLSRNFFIESLAWMVRSGLVAKFLQESLKLPPVKRFNERAEAAKTKKSGKKTTSKQGRKAIKISSRSRKPKPVPSDRKRPARKPVRK
jgi:hypothetical protein